MTLPWAAVPVLVRRHVVMRGERLCLLFVTLPLDPLYIQQSWNFHVA